jgi:BA14K-like protein
LSTAALMALALPLAMSSEAFAQHRGGQGGYAARGGGPSASFGGGGGMRGGGVATAGPRFSGGGGMTAGTRFSGGAGPGFGGRVATSGPSGNWQGGNRNWQGGNWQGGNRWAGGYGRPYRRGGGFWPGVAVGAAIGGSYAYYGGSGYYDPGYYDDSYYYDDSAAVAVAPEGGDGATCAQTYRSYDPASGMYLGYDGQWHPCP